MKQAKTVAIITGSSRGIGRAIALELARAGARIVLNCRQNVAAAERVQAEVEALGSAAAVVTGSVADAAVASNLVTTALDRFGRLDVLVNNAGILSRQFLMLTKPEAWQECVDTNLSGAFHCTQAALKPLVEQRSGNIVNISSVAAMRGLPGQVCYASTKAALVGMTRVLAKEVARYNIRVNAVAAGYIATDMLSPRDMAQITPQTVPLGAAGEPEDVAHLVAFLVSQRAKYITGQLLCVDGGLSA